MCVAIWHDNAWLSNLSMTLSHTDYRPDIDGLRAFAVLSVVLFHAFPSLLPGGFVGVDVFFVISGYLISGIMFKGLQDGSFRFSDFYARRVKRIFPALIVVSVASYVFGWFVLFSDELSQLGSHLTRAAVFLSNFILWHESGYFDNAAETKPLLHLWSLGIEEQFYIVWPVLLWALWRFKSWRAMGMLACVVLSFAWNMYQSQHDLVHDFYSPLTRFWELLCGALLAYAGAPQTKPALSEQAWWAHSTHLRGALGAMCLALAVSITDARHFPGVWALLPVTGAVLLISATPKAWVNRVVLSRGVCVWLGTISYPLYLWHWPIFSFARIVEGGTPSVMWRSAALLASVGLAWLTFWAVEKPLRFTWNFRYKTALLVLAMAGVGVLGHVTHKSDGYPSRAVMQPEHVVRGGDLGHDEFHDYFKQHFFPCAETSIYQEAGAWKGMVRCFQSKPQPQVDLVLLGDSHAEHLFLGLATSLPQLNVAFYVKGALPSLNGPEFKTILSHVLPDKHIQKVVLAGMWSGHASEVKQSAGLENALGPLIDALEQAGKKVYLIDDIPQFSFDPQRCKFQRPLTQSTKCDAPIAEFQAQRQSYLGDWMQVIKRHPEVAWVDLSRLMCNDQTCGMARDGQVLYRDNNHLNIPGSLYIGKHIVMQHPSLGVRNTQRQP